MPAADDLFRPTAGQQDASSEEATAQQAEPSDGAEVTPAAPSKPSGRVRHDEKMTVYVTSAELVAIEQARLRLRSEHGLAIDRGRLVREALGLVLADLEDRGADSDLVSRLTEGQE